MGRGEAEAIRTRILGPQDRESALAYLLEAPFENLVLIDSVSNLGSSRIGRDIVPVIYGAFDGPALCGIASLRPSIVFSIGMDDAVLASLLPLVRRVPSGLIKCNCEIVARIWSELEEEGRAAIIDRIESSYLLEPDGLRAVDAHLPGLARPARPEDLEDLVYAARASLWEEDRPDPAVGDPLGFRRWVEGRLGRARIVSDEGKLVFVSYADVRRPEGWLVQGVYTWPAARRRGFARRGMDFLIREAFAEGAAHIQLAVVDGNERASALYRDLGFEMRTKIRTILFR